MSFVISLEKAENDEETGSLSSFDFYLLVPFRSWIVT